MKSNCYRFILLSIILVFMCFNSSLAKSQTVQIDTTYYDNNWKGIEYPAFASYYRIILNSDDPSASKRFRTYFIDGKLQSEGYCKSFDKNDGSNVVFDGLCVFYYKNGNKECVAEYSNGKVNGIYEYYFESGQLCQKMIKRDGKINGNYIEYYENGNKKEESYAVDGNAHGNAVLFYDSGKIDEKIHFKHGIRDGKYTKYSPDGFIIKECSYKNGKLDGLYTEFRADDTYKQIIYENGYPKNDFYYIGNINGLMSKYRISDNSLYWESPSIDDRQTMYRKGTPWQYYSQNGLNVALTSTVSNEYGKWFKIEIIITNGSLESITFDPNRIDACSSKKGKMTMLDVWPCSQYMAHVQSVHKISEALMSVTEDIKNKNAGYSASTTQTNKHYSGTVDNYGVNAAVGATVGGAIGTNGAAIGGAVSTSVGAYANSTIYSGNTSTTSTTVSYDAFTAYQQEVLSAQKMQAYANSHWEERKAIEKGYLEKTTIYPGETISGYIYVDRKKGETVSFNLYINNTIYRYDWTY